MFQATKSRMPARAASGTWLASGAATSRMNSRAKACTMPATGLVAPARTLVTVRAMVPVAGMPPKNGVTMLATPCAISSWFGSWRLCSLMLSATRAHSSDSMAPSSAIVMIGIVSWRRLSQLSGGMSRLGRPRGSSPKREPMVSTGSFISQTASVSVASATMGAGSREAQLIGRLPSGCVRSAAAWENSRGHSASPATHSTPIAKA